MSILVISGTSTDVGKTIVTAALTSALTRRGARVGVCKPAQTGVGDGDAGDLDVIAALADPAELLELARYPDPLAPDVAARLSGRDPLHRKATRDAILALAARVDVTLVEGAGGVAVRLGSEQFTIVDVAADLDADVLVVASAGLGTLNHSALTVHALRAAGVGCAGLVLGAWPVVPDLATRTNIDELPSVTGTDIAGVVPDAIGGWGAADVARVAETWFAAQLLDSLYRSATVGEQSRAWP